MSRKRKTTEEINSLFQQYNVICTSYGGWVNPASFKCNVCSKEWTRKINPNTKPYCPFCHSEKLGRGGKSKHSHKDFIESIKDRNISTLEEYTDTHTKMWFQCTICDYKWKTVPHSIKNGRGCSVCANKHKSEIMSLKYYNKPTLHYLIYFPRKKLYKTGITTRTISERFSKESEPYLILASKKYLTGKPAWIAEQLILKRHQKFYKYATFLKAGKHECFSRLFLIYK